MIPSAVPRPHNSTRHLSWKAIPCALLLAPAALAQTSSVDSAGVTIVRNVNPASAPVTFQVAAAPRLRLGAPNNDLRYEFVQAQAAVGLRDGGIAVALQRESEVRVFDSTGMHVRTFGRKGSGPGEMSAPTFLARGRGDTLIVHEQIRNNLLFFTVDGTYIRTIPRTARSQCCLPDGRLLSTAVRRTPTRQANERPTLAAVSIPPDSVQFRPDTLTFFPGSDPMLSIPLPAPPPAPAMGGLATTVSGFLSLPTPFGRRAHQALFGSGFVTGDGTTWELREYNERGKLTRIIRAAAEPAAVTASVRRGYESEALRDRVGAQRSRELAALRAYKYPERAPVFRALMSDESGRLWVEQYPMPGDAKSTWGVFSPAGVLLGRAELPRDHSVLWIGAKEILTRWYDGKTGTAQIHVFPYTRLR